MRVVTGMVVDGQVELSSEFLAEGEPVRLSSAEEQELLEARDQIRGGEFVDGDDLLNELRSLLRA